MVLPLRVAWNQAASIKGEEARKVLSNVSIAPLDYQLETLLRCGVGPFHEPVTLIFSRMTC